jgi:hypothetical protein
LIVERRTFLERGLLGGGLLAFASQADPNSAFDPRGGRSRTQTMSRALPPINSITPIVGDGRWIWNEPPEETGYLDPRDYELEIGIYLTGRGPARMLKATTPLPVELPEQHIEDAKIETRGCSAIVRPVSMEAAQLLLAAPMIAKGQVISAVAKMRLTLFKQYQGYTKQQFEFVQPAPPIAFRQQYMFDSPGIQTRAAEVRRLQRDITGESLHPWDAAYRIYQWVWENIQGRIGNFTSVVAALRSRVGDCEERAACFVALCRAAGIPARLVWIPNHNWAEFYLVDSAGDGHWIPAHTAAYSWFGWTGAHELVIQKGDKLYAPEKRQPQRLLADWTQWKGTRPETRFTARIRPLPRSDGEDCGPGARVKNIQGQWVLEGSHRLDQSLRDGDSPGTVHGGY